MSTTVACPSCSKKLQANEDLVGKRVKCPGCGQPFAVPGLSPAPASLPQQREPLPGVKQPISRIGERSLRRLRRAHQAVANARSRTLPILLPVALGLGLAIVAFVGITVAGALLTVAIEGPREEDSSRPASTLSMVLIVGAPSLTALGMLIGFPLYYRHRVKQRWAAELAQAEAELHACVSELQEQVPDWVKSMGGRNALLDPHNIEAEFELREVQEKQQLSSGNPNESAR